MLFYFFLVSRWANLCCRCLADIRCGLNVFSNLVKSAYIAIKFTGSMAARETTVPMITASLQASSKSFGDTTETSVVVGAFVTTKNRFIYLHKSKLLLETKEGCSFWKDLEKDEAKLFQGVYEE